MAAARWLEFAAAAVLFGAPLLFLNGLDPTDVRLAWPRSLSPLCAALVALGAVAALALQTASITEGPVSLRAVEQVLGDTTFGHGTGARLFFAAVAYVAALNAPGRASWLLTAAGGAGVLASFAWTGHGAMDDGGRGALHLGSDILHLLSAGVWVGALAGLLMLLARGPRQAALTGLTRFSGVGMLVVAVLLASGLVNAWLLIGTDRLTAALATDYGRLLIAKLVIFVAMLGLAAANRLLLTPRLGRDSGGAVPALKWSIGIETLLAAAVLGIVAVMGTLAPPMAM